jgi:uncharacterized protein involved in exopolysaccharide biosynthesis
VLSTTIERHKESSLMHEEPDEGIDIVVFSRLLWRYRVLVAALCAVGALVAVIVGLVSIPIFRGEVVVAAAHDQGQLGGGSGQGIMGAVGGLASLAGVDIQAGSAEEKAAQGVLESRHLIEEFIRRYNLLPELSRDANHPLTMWRAVDLFKKTVVIVNKDQKRELTTVIMEWKDASTAARWANDFLALANELIRTRALEESRRNITYLTAQLERTADVDMRKVMFGIIESETKRLMLANGRIEYAFQVIDPAVAPEVRARPRRTLLAWIGLGLGLLVGITVALVMDRFARHGHRTPS